MSKFLRTWNVITGKNEGTSLGSGFSFSGKVLNLVADGINLRIDAVSGITLVPGGVTDAFLAQIVTANKVAGSAVQLQSLASGGIFNSGGLGLRVRAPEFSFDAVSGLTLVEVPTSKLQSNVVLTDGTRAFTQPQAGVDAISNSHLTTLGQVNSLISAAISGDFSEQLINLSGQTVFRGYVGFVEGVSGSFQLALASSPARAKIQYVCSATTSILDGASGSFNNPSTEINNVSGILASFAKGDEIFLSTTLPGRYGTAPSVSGMTIASVGWKVKDDKFVFFPSETLDL